MQQPQNSAVCFPIQCSTTGNNIWHTTIFAHIFCERSTYFLELVVFWNLLLKINFSVRNNFLLMMNMFSKEFWSELYVFLVLKSMLYPLCVHRIIKVDSILYEKFALWTYSPFQHEVSLLYFSWNNLLRVLTYVCRHCNIKCF